MADETGRTGGPLPPKLNLKKGSPAGEPPAGGQPQTPAPVPTAAPTASPDDVSGTTMHIQVPETAQPSAGAAPKTMKMKRPAELGGPKPTGVKPATPVASQEESGTTMHIQVPAAAGAVAAPAVRTVKSPKPMQAAAPPGSPPGSKKDTSRIPLDAASAVAGGEPAEATPKTIRIKPTASPSTIKIAKPGPSAAAAPLASAMTDKSKTSRISLEAALGSGEAPAAGGGPKTIRLKRPSEASTVKLSQKPGAPRIAAAPVMDKTARLDETTSIPEEVKGTPTGRKTIRVKRPTRAGGVKTGVTVKRKVGAAAAPADGAEAAVEAEEEAPEIPVRRHDEPGVVWSIFTIAAIFTIGVMLWVFFAQAIGPNSSMTQYSYAPLWKNLSWPGKMRGERNFVRQDNLMMESGTEGGGEFGEDEFADESFDEEGMGEEGAADAEPVEGEGAAEEDAEDDLSL